MHDARHHPHAGDEAACYPLPAVHGDAHAQLALRVDNLVDALEYLRRNVDAIRAGAMADLSTVSHQQAAQEGEIAALKVHAKAADMAIERIADAVQALVLRGDK